MQITFDAGRLIQGATPDADFSLTKTQTPTTVGGGSGTEAVQGVTYATATAAAEDNNWRVDVSIGPNAANENYVLSSQTAGTCSINQTSRQVSYVAGGLCTIHCSIPGLGTRKIEQTMVQIGGATTRTSVQSLAAGSLLKHLTDSANALCAATTPGVSQRWFETAQSDADLKDSFGLYTRNASMFLYRSDVAGWTPPSVAELEKLMIDRWISPNHKILPIGRTHGLLVDSATIKLVGDDYRIQYVPGNTGAGKVIKLLPSNWASYLPQVNNLARIPFWTLRKNRADSTDRWYIEARDMSVVSLLGLTGQQDQAGYGQIASSPRSAFQYADYLNNLWTGGDSGSFIFVIINGTPVLIGEVGENGGHHCDFFGAQHTAIIAAMNSSATGGGEVSPNYSLETINLSGFTAF